MSVPTDPPLAGSPTTLRLFAFLSVNIGDHHDCPTFDPNNHMLAKLVKHGQVGAIVSDGTSPSFIETIESLAADLNERSSVCIVDVARSMPSMPTFKEWTSVDGPIEVNNLSFFDPASTDAKIVIVFVPDLAYIECFLARLWSDHQNYFLVGRLFKSAPAPAPMISLPSNVMRKTIVGATASYSPFATRADAVDHLSVTDCINGCQVFVPLHHLLHEAAYSTRATNKYGA